MRKAILILSVILFAHGCVDDHSACLTSNAFRDVAGICRCPEGTHIEVSTCVNDRGSATDPSSIGDGGSTRKPRDAGGAMAKKDGSAPAATQGEESDASSPPDVGASSPSEVDDAGTTDPVSKPPSCVAIPESCDGKDNDCDGLIDNGVKNECGACGVLDHAKGESCSNGGQGPCAKPGTYQCMGETLVCSAPPASPSTEVCDGIDNDCDGVADDGIVKNACQGCASLAHAKGSACSDGVGECKVNGTWDCMGTESVACTAKARAGTSEVCDGKDNDCDGMVDEGVTNCVNGQVNDCPPDACAPGSCEDGVNSYTCRCGAGYFAVGHECTRFRNNGDFTISDAKTGLVWQQDVDANSYSYAEALAYCAGIQLGASKGRLPTLDELKSLVDSRFTPPIDPQYFKGTSASTSDLRAIFWSSTPAGSSTSPVTGVFYGYSYAAVMSAAINADTAVSVRCVR